jgi:putative chitinase
LGNTVPGDGLRFRGRGLLQTTGRANYLATGKALGADLIANPERLAEPELASRSAGWFWKTHGCNAVC